VDAVEVVLRIGLHARVPADFFAEDHFGVDDGRALAVAGTQVEADPAATIRQVGAALSSAPIDIAFVGIGENGHLAFNDPPADFETEQSYLVVELDAACRRQQLGEGWFADISQVPTRAVSMSIRQILKAREILVIVPDARKAQAVKDCFEGEITNLHPASILRSHPNAFVYLDRDSSALLSP